MSGIEITHGVWVRPLSWIYSGWEDLPAIFPKRRPAKAKLVAAFYESLSPASSRTDQYFISKSKDKKFWLLWLRHPADGDGGAFEGLAAYQAAGGENERQAAEHLLTEAWKADLLFDGFDRNGPGLSKANTVEGLLDLRALKTTDKQVRDWCEKPASQKRVKLLKGLYGGMRDRYELGIALLKGDEFPQDVSKGMELLKGAAAAGQRHALVELAQQYLEGINLPQDAVAARGLLYLAKGCYPPKHLPVLAKIYWEGLGTHRLPLVAVALYKLAAEGGIDQIPTDVREYEIGLSSSYKDEVQKLVGVARGQLIDSNVRSLE